MPLIFSDGGAQALLLARFNNSWPASKDLSLRLYCNDLTPEDSHSAGWYAEAEGGGYTAKTLTCGSWTISQANGIYQAAYTAQTFTFTGQLTTRPSIYGYYVTDGNGILQWAERRATPVTPTISGDQLIITPVFQASKGTPT